MSSYSKIGIGHLWPSRKIFSEQGNLATALSAAEGLGFGPYIISDLYKTRAQCPDYGNQGTGAHTWSLDATRVYHPAVLF